MCIYHLLPREAAIIRYSFISPIIELTSNIAAVVVVTMATEYHCILSAGLTDMLLTALELLCSPVFSHFLEKQLHWILLDGVDGVSVRMRSCVNNRNLAPVC